MAQSFDCLCNSPTCRGLISGARNMTDAQLDGIWLNGHIIQQRAEQRLHDRSDPTASALADMVAHAEKGLEAARLALRTYTSATQINGNGVTEKVTNGKLAASEHRGQSSRMLGGEMGGDTTVAA